MVPHQGKGIEDKKKRKNRKNRRREEELVVLEAVWSWFWRQSGAGKNKSRVKKRERRFWKLEAAWSMAKKIGPFAADVVVRPVGEDKKMK